MARPRKQQRQAPPLAPPLEAAAPEAHSHPLVLTSAQEIATRVNLQLGFMPHVVSAISVFLDNSHKWTLESATDAGSVHLLEILRAREWDGASRDLREARFLRAIRHAAAKGYLDVLNWWRTKYLPTAWSEETRIAVIRIAAVHGHLHMLELFLKDDRNLQTIINMSESGHPLICQHAEIVHWIDDRSRRAKLSILLENAIKEADFEFLKWVYSRRERYRLEFSDEDFNTAVEAGRLDVLQWLTKHEGERFSTQAMDFAAKTGQLAIMKWLDDTYVEDCDDLDPYELPGSDVVSNGHLDVVKWIVEESKFLFLDEYGRLSWLIDAIAAAAEVGNWAILKYLVDHCPRDASTPGMVKAIIRGDLEMVNWLHTNGFQCPKDGMRIAAKHGHLAILQWLYQNIPHQETNADAMDAAAANNHLDIVKWLHENQAGCCSETAMRKAASNGHLEMVQWLITNRPEFGVANAADSESPKTKRAVPPEIMTYAASKGHLELVKFLREHLQEPYPAFAMDIAAGNGHLNIVKWLHFNTSAGCSIRAMNLAAAKGHLHIIQWLHEHRTEGCTEEAVNGAAANGHLKIVQWLLENRSEGFSVIGIHQATLNGHDDTLALLLSSRPDFVFEEMYAEMAACSGYFQVLAILDKFDSKIVDRAVAQMLRHHRDVLVNAYQDVDELSVGSHALTLVESDQYEVSAVELDE